MKKTTLSSMTVI